MVTEAIIFSYGPHSGTMILDLETAEGPETTRLEPGTMKLEGTGPMRLQGTMRVVGATPAEMVHFRCRRKLKF